MKVHYRSKTGRLVFEIEGGTQKEVFEGIADIQEVFEADDTCGLCKSPDIGFRVRDVQGNKYFELRCHHCYAQFNFGQSKDMKNLFPKRQDKEGNWLPNRGWFKYRKEEENVA